MERRSREEFEELNAALNDDAQLVAYRAPYDNYKVGRLPSLLGSVLIACGNMLYGRAPTYLKFRAIEIIARVPYHSWSSAAYTMLTIFVTNEKRAMRLSGIAHFARHAQDNETMHVIVISHLAREIKRAGFIHYTLIPVLFAFAYFWGSYVLYLLNPRWSYELNYLFEQHAFEQYDRFITLYRESLEKKPVVSEFLTWYGRAPRSQYEFFRSVRNDEIIHRNQSVHAILNS